MNEIFLDTETTGLSFNEGHKVVEIACIETKDLIPTNRVDHKFISPKRSMPAEAFKIHVFSEQFLSDKETFDHVAEGFLDFIKAFIYFSFIWSSIFQLIKFVFLFFTNLVMF